MDNINNKHNMAKSISLKDLEDCIRDIMFKEEDIIIDDEYIYEINNNVIKAKTRRSKKN